MSVIIKNYKPINLVNSKLWRFSSTSADISLRKDEDEEEFRVLDILKKRQRFERKKNKRNDVQPDRADRMATDQKWSNVWPGPKTFHPSSVPLPIRQGYVPKGQAPPAKKANAELMKIPNFLHLTPPAIKMHCEAIKKYCTEWPILLNSEEVINKHYPIEITTTDYCHASPTIRNPKSRIVSLKVKLSDLNLDSHARDKFLRLVGDRYNIETDIVDFTADRCPLKKQNLDYVNYLLTACYHEAWTYEEWENQKSEEDMEYYNWDNNASKRGLVNWYRKSKNETKELSNDEYKSFDISCIEHGNEYKNVVTKYFNEGESADIVKSYGDAVRKLFSLPSRKGV